MPETSYEEFGDAFFHRAVTAERVAATVARVAGETIEVGPLPVGPGGIATAKALGKVQKIEATQTSRAPITHRVQIPVALELEVRLAGQKHRFNGSLTLTLLIAARAEIDPLRVIIDIAPLTQKDVAISMEASGLQARILKRLGDMDNEIREQVTRVVGELLEAPAAQEVRVIDIEKIIEETWT